jgi:hypothetical protein
MLRGYRGARGPGCVRLIELAGITQIKAVSGYNSLRSPLFNRALEFAPFAAP